MGDESKPGMRFQRLDRETGRSCRWPQRRSNESICEGRKETRRQTSRATTVTDEEMITDAMSH